MLFLLIRNKLGLKPKKMKVLLINGSPLKEGNTFVSLSEIAKQLKVQGVDSEILWIGNKPARGCIDCCTCRKQGLGRCVFNDDMCNVIIDKMAECDGIVLGSPVYYGQPSGQLLSLQQRMLFSGVKSFQDKPAAVVCVCRRGGSSAAFQTLQMPFQMCNMPIVTSQYWNIVFGCQEGEAALDVEGMQTMRTLANNMAWLLKKIHNEPTTTTPEREDWQAMNFIR
jgi:multimeric flavodoxin WrbA